MLQFVSGDATMMGGEVAQWVSPSFCCKMEHGPARDVFRNVSCDRKSLSPKVSECKVCRDVLENAGEGVK